MPIEIKQRPENEAPKPNRKPNEDLIAVKNAMIRLGKGMVLEIEAGSEKAVRGTKALVTRSAKELGSRWQHWHVGTKVFAKPIEENRPRRGRRRKEQS